DHAGGLAVEAEFLCRFDGGPDDRSRSRTLHGQAHGCQDHRSEGKPSLADLSSRRNHEADPGSSRPARLAGGQPKGEKGVSVSLSLLRKSASTSLASRSARPSWRVAGGGVSGTDTGAKNPSSAGQI